MINPFRPNAPTRPGMFVGRYDEIVRIESALIQTRASKNHSFLLLGERGIGKTSLMNLVKFFSEGRIDVNGEKLNFLVIETDISSETNQIGLIKKVELALQRKLAKTEPTKQLFSDIWSFIKTIEAAGVKIGDKKQTDNEIIFEQFCYSLADTANRITQLGDKSNFDTTYDGIIILIDEADNASKELDLGVFIKLLLERLQKEGCEKLMFGVAGLPITKEILRKSHPSSLRLFEELYLNRLSKEEVKEVIQKTLRETSQYGPAVTISTDGEEMLIELSEGFPHFIHQYGFCAFEKSDKRTITEQNVLDGATDEHGAIEAIGDKYYKDDYYNKIKDDKYRQVLHIMAENLDSWVTKKQIKEKYKGTMTTLNNAISALLTRKIIIAKEGARGTYRLQDKGFAWWIQSTTKIKSGQ